MTVETTTSFDLETFKRGYEEWDIEALLALYADEVELIQIDRDNPPSAPRTRHGSDVLRGMLEHCAGAGVVARWRTRSRARSARGDDHCEFPGGRRVANAILELEDGRIVRELTSVGTREREREAHAWRAPGGPQAGGRHQPAAPRELEDGAHRRGEPTLPGTAIAPRSDQRLRTKQRRRSMPKASKETASEHETVEGYEGHFEHFDGGWTVGFEAYSQDADLAPFFKGLPNDQCQCEHMGYVIRGRSASARAATRSCSRPATLLRRPGATRRSCTRAPRWSSSARPRSSAGPWRS